MKVIWDRTKPFLTVGAEVLGCSCRVRNEENRLRKASEIVYSMPDGLPYQPRQFPIGSWTILKPRPKYEDWLKPWFIPTTAWQKLPVWKLKSGLYSEATDQMVTDSGYGIHWSETSLSTWGCIRMNSRDEIERLVALVTEARQNEEEVLLEVF